MSDVTVTANANIARHLALMAAQQPERAALKVPRGRAATGEIDYLTLTFSELDAEVAAWCERLAQRGVRRGDRTLVMVRQGLPLIASVFALFRIGAVPVVIDPGMGLKNFLACVRRSQPRALVGVPLARVISRLFPRAFRSVDARVEASGSLTARLPALKLAQRSSADVATSAPNDLAAILFTSGSTGAPKGVCYEHGMFEAQVQAIRETYAIQPGEIDLPLLPIFALFNPALGMTTIVPEIDPRRPAAVDPVKIVQAIRQEDVTNSFGSPTLWRIIGEYCVASGVTLPSLRRVLCAGAPVPASLWESSRLFLPNGRLHSPYGATEALPVSTVASDEISVGPPPSLAKNARNIADAGVRGACVGRPLHGIDVRIIEIVDAPIASIDDARELPRGEIGEIIVRGAVVTKVYDAAAEATAAAKIPDTADSAGPGRVWHRMGDCGYFDADGRIWFCGRKVERVETPDLRLFTEPCERVFRRHPQVVRCAMIGIGQSELRQQEPALVVEADLPDEAGARKFAGELRALALTNSATRTINRFYFRKKFPVDVRHNAKIHRLTLARWAERIPPVIVRSDEV